MTRTRSGWRAAALGAGEVALALVLFSNCSESQPAGHERSAGHVAATPSPTGPSESPRPRDPPDIPESEAEPALCGTKKATVTGTSTADHFTGTRKRDVIVTLGGDDVVEDVGAEDLVCTGPGDDVVTSERRSGPSAIDLGPGDDRVRAHSAGDVNGGSGADRVRVYEAGDIDGGPGADRIVVDRGVAAIRGGPGDDYLRAVSQRIPYGYPENAPCLNYRSAPRSVRVNLVAERAVGEGQDTVVGFHCVTGSRYGDLVVGTDKRDGVNGGYGYDVLYLGAGPDVAMGGPQADEIHLGPGDDYGNGEEGWDRLYGEDGSDNLEGWSEGDYLDGGAGNDQLYAALFCAIGGNTYDTAGLMDEAGNELFGGLGDDYLVGDKGNDRIDGGPGFDYVQPGYRDGRVDWIESTEQMLEGCLDYPTMERLFRGNVGH